jgi:predicted nucleic acid-binding protein
MPLLLDTTVLIDVVRGFAPTVRWLGNVAVGELHVSAITIGELHRGAWLRHPHDALSRDAELRHFEAGPLRLLGDRVLAFDRAAAAIWGRLLGEGQAAGRPPPKGDAQIAAIALCRGLTVATSNTAHFAALCPTIDPRAV